MQTTQAIIIATSVLHNICRLNNISDVEPEVDIPLESDNTSHVQEVPNQNSHRARQDLINNYFTV